MSTTCLDRRLGGFAIVSAIFILVVLSALAGFIVSVTTTQNITSAQDIQSARAYQAARAGVEWGIAKWLDAAPDCTAGNTTISLGGDLSEFSITVARNPIPPSSGISFCEIIATASAGGTAGAPIYVERQIRVIVEGA